MTVKVICSDCGRHIGSFVLTGGKQDREIEIHACYHKDIYNHIKELQTENEQLKEKLKEEYNRGIKDGLNQYARKITLEQEAKK